MDFIEVYIISVLHVEDGMSIKDSEQWKDNYSFREQY